MKTPAEESKKLSNNGKFDKNTLTNKAKELPTKPKVLPTKPKDLSVQNKPKSSKEGRAFAPRPNIDNCPNRGVWSEDEEKNKKMVELCKKYAGTIGSYGEKIFFCNGKPMSEYNTAQVCSMNSIVAMEQSDCENPCYQTRAPDRSSKASGDSLQGTGIRAPGDNINFLKSKENYSNSHPLATYKSPPNGSQWIGVL